MIEIKKDKIIADGLEKNFENISVISLGKKYLSFSSKIADCTKYDKDIDTFYQELIKAGLNGFVLINDNIFNLNNIIQVEFDFYQYAGISIHKCSKEDAELCLLTLVCKNNKRESIPFRTFKEAEICYKEINKKLNELKQGDLSCN